MNGAEASLVAGMLAACVADIAKVVGWVLIVVGVALLWSPWALVIGGVLLVAWAVAP